MTAIIGMTDADGSVWLIGDSAASNRDSVFIQKDKKVWRHGELALAFCGSFRGRDLLQSALRLPDLQSDEDPESWLRTTFVDAVRKVFKDGGFLTHFAEGHEQNLSSLLVGVRARVFIMRNDFSIGESVDGYTAIGSGAPEAMGSLYSTRAWPTVKDRLVEAMNASVHVNSGTVRPPYHWVRTEPWPGK